VEGGYKVNEWFFEASIPLVEGRPFAEEVMLDLGYRYSDYDPPAARPPIPTRSPAPGLFNPM
jgi:hypothetical protein